MQCKQHEEVSAKPVNERPDNGVAKRALSPLPEWEGIEMNADLLEITKESRRSHQHDVERRHRYESAKNQKRRARARKRGFRPEGGREHVHALREAVRDRIKSLVRPATRANTEAWLREVERLKASIPYETEKSQFELIDIFIRVSSYMVFLSSCQDLAQARDLTINTLLQNFSSEKVATMIDQYMAHMKLKPEGTACFTQWYKQLESVTVTIAETPLGKFLFNIFSVMVVHGFSASKLFPESQIQVLLGKVETDLYKRSGPLTYIECLLGILEYVAGCFDHILTGGQITSYLFPQCLHTSVVEIQDKVTKLLLGKDDPDGKDKAISIMDELVNLEARLKIAVECRYTNARLILVYSQYYKAVKRSILDVQNFSRNTSYRKAPFCVFLVGESQVGKSTLYPLLINAIGVANGRRYKENEVASLSEMSKYDDAIRQNTKIVKMDDVSSVKVKNRDFSDLAISKIIGINQSIPTATNQSQAEKKDAIYHNEDGVIGSSNMMDLGILEVFQTCEAAFNRVNIYYVSVHPNFRNENGTLNKEKMIKETIDGIPPEAHLFQRMEWERVNEAREYMSIPKGPEMRTGEFIKHITERCRAHVAHQTTLFRNQSIVTNCALCSLCGCPNRMCTCAEPVAFVPEVQALRSEGIVDRIIFEHLDNYSLEVLRWSMRHFGSHLGSGVCQLLQRNALRIVAVFARVYFMSIYRLSYLWGRALLLFCVMFLSYNLDSFRESWGIYLSVLLSIFLMLYLALLGYGSAVRAEITESVTSAIISRSNHTIVVGGVLFITALGTLRHLSSMIFNMKSGNPEESREVVQSVQAALPSTWTGSSPGTFIPAVDPEGNISPTSMEEVQARQKEHSDWEKTHLSPLNMDPRASTMTPAQLVNVLDKNMYRIRFPIGKQRFTSCNLLFIEDNVAIASRHVYDRCIDREGLVELVKNQTVHFHTRITFAWAPTEQKDSDIIFLQFARCGSMNSLSHLLTDADVNGLGYMVRKDHGSGAISSTQARFGVFPIQHNHPEIPYVGYTYNLNPGSRLGDCGAVCFTTSRPFRIFGTHCAGNGSNVCIASFLRKKWFEEFRKRVQNPPQLSPEGDTPLPFATGSEVDTNPYGFQSLDLDPEMEMRSCVTHYPGVEAGGVHPRGFATSLRVTGFSEVRYSELAQPLKDLGLPLVYGPPRMNSNIDHAVTFEKRMEPMRDIKASLLRHAIYDYTQGIIEFMDEIDWKKRPPLSLSEALNGVPGNRFIGPVDESTAAGFGVKGKKTELIEVTYDAQGYKRLAPKDMLAAKIKDQLLVLRRGERLSPVVKTSVKDEGVKVDEEGNPLKTNRIFFTMPTDTLCLSKMLFAPVLEVIGSCPLISECAAGINVTRNDWGQLRDHIVTFGTACIMEGDYSGWDVRLSGQLIRAAGLVCIHIARRLGYSEADICAMNGIISDLASTVVVYNGAVCIFDGWMPSGSFVTLAFNSICNSLLHRCAFFRMAHEGVCVPTTTKFRDCVKLITMGDDSLAGVKANSFTMYDMQEFCHSIGIKYTCGDKSAVDRPYVHAVDMTFCKRKWVWNETIGQWLAPLALDSIYKSIYLTRTSKMDSRDILVQQVDAALRELARHPQEVFETSLKLIRTACSRADIDQLIPRLAWSYDMWIEELNARYFLENSLDETVLFSCDDLSF